MSKAVVLFSGGQDSTTCLYWARSRYDSLLALTYHYGQRHRAEVEAATAIAKLAGVDHLSMEMPSLAGSALTDATQPIDTDGGIGGLPSSFVPVRNAVLLSLAANRAIAIGAQHIVTGVCETDYSGYPDCRSAFLSAFEHMVRTALPEGHSVEVVAPLLRMTKAQTVRMARDLPGCWEALALSVTCYEGQRPGCGTCPSCKLRRKGFDEAGLSDPAGG